MTRAQLRSTGLLAGALLGALLAASGLLEEAAETPQHIVASVDGEAIAAAELESFLSSLAEERRAPLTAADKQQVLDRLIDEKLLIRRAEQTGLTRNTATVRKAIVDAMVEAALMQAERTPPTEADIEAFYLEHSDYFREPPLLAVRQMLFKGDEASARAATAKQALQAGEDWASVNERLANHAILSLPGSLLPANRLPTYLGPSLTEAALKQAQGDIGGPYAAQGNTVLLQVTARQDGQLPPLAQIREQVQRELTRRRDEQALRTYLDELRGAAQIDINRAALDAL